MSYKKSLFIGAGLTLVSAAVLLTPSANAMTFFPFGAHRGSSESKPTYSQSFSSFSSMSMRDWSDQSWFTKQKDRYHGVLTKSCDTVKERITKKIAKFEENKDRHLSRYQAMKDKIQTFITQAQNEGRDITQLTADLATWDGLIQTSAAQYSSYINLLKIVEATGCDDSATFNQKLQEARQQLSVFRQSLFDVRNFYWNTIKPDIKALKV